MSPVFLGAGEQLTVPTVSDAGLLQPRPIDTEARTSNEHTLVFDDSPLADVVEEFNRYNAKQIVLSTPTLADVRISGVFAASEPSSLLHFLKEQMHFEVIQNDDRIDIEDNR